MYMSCFLMSARVSIRSWARISKSDVGIYFEINGILKNKRNYVINFLWRKRENSSTSWWRRRIRKHNSWANKRLENDFIVSGWITWSLIVIYTLASADCTRRSKVERVLFLISRFFKAILCFTSGTFKKTRSVTYLEGIMLRRLLSLLV